MTAFRTTRRVEFVDTDMAGIAHFSNFYRWMESAEVEMLRSRGFSVTLKWEGQKVSFPRVSASCDFIQPIRFMDEIEIAVSVARVGQKSVTYSFEFFKSGELVAKGQVTAVCCKILDAERIESMEIPSSIRALLESL